MFAVPGGFVPYVGSSDVLCPVLLVQSSQSVFPLRGSFCLFICFVIINKAYFPPAIGVLAISFTPDTWQNEPTMKRTQRRKGLYQPSPASTLSSPLYEGHPPVQGPALPPSAGYWHKDVCPEIQRYSRGVGVHHAALKDMFNSVLDELLSWWRMRGAVSPSVLGVCGVPDSFPSDGGWSTSSGSRGGRPGARCRPGGCSRACSSPGAHRARSSGGQRSCSALSSVGWSCSTPSCGRWSSSTPVAAEEAAASRSQKRRRRRKKASSTLQGLEAVPEMSAGQEAVPELPKLLALPAPPKLLALPAPPKRLAPAGAAQAPRPAGASQAPRPAVPPRLLVLPAPLKCLALPAPPRLPVLPGPPWQPAKLLAPPWPPDRLEPAWSVPPAPPWPSSRVPVRPDPPCSSRHGHPPGFPFGRILHGLSLRLRPGFLPGSLDCVSLPGSTLPSLPGPAELPCWHWLGLPSLPPLFVSVFWLFLSGLLLCVSLCVVMFLCCHVSVLFLVSLIRDAGGVPFGGGVVSGFCHFGLVLSMVLWQSPDTPILSAFSCERAASSVLESRALLVLRAFVSCWSVVFGSRHSCLEFWSRDGVRTLALHFLSLCECAVSSSLGTAHSCPRGFVVLHAVRVSIGCVHLCCILCCVARSLYIHGCVL